MPNETVTVTWKGGAEFDRALRSMVDNVEHAAKMAVREGAEAIAADAKGRIHPVTGNLGRSITADVQTLGGRYVAEVGPHGVVYALRQEGRHPYMKPAYEAKGPAAQAQLEARVAAAMRR